MRVFRGLSIGARIMEKTDFTRPTLVSFAHTATASAAAPTSRTPVLRTSHATVGRVKTLDRADPINSGSEGSGRGFHTSGVSSGISACESSITWAISMAPVPSTRTWWLLVTTAKSPFSKPSMRYISHKGRDRSSGRAMSRATNSSNWSRVPGFGSAERRTWYATSNVASSTHTGRDSPNGTSRIRCRYRGTCAMRLRIRRTSRS